jgi:hypothetical protein
MGNMPEWFAKTPEMCASDLYFSRACTEEERIALGRKYLLALQTLQDNPTSFFGGSKALDASPDFDATRKDHRDWISERYDPNDPSTFHLGGRYWPGIPSIAVIDVIEKGTRMAIMKALGETNLVNMQVHTDTIVELFRHEEENNVNRDGILPIATSWNCVAPPGSTFFEAAALRGPTIVELAIATPRPVALTRFAIMIDKIGHDEMDLDAHEFNVDIVP